MQIVWKNNAATPYFFRHAAEWDGLKIHHAKVVAGHMPEQSSQCHELNIPLAGLLTTERVTGVGTRKITKSRTGNVCFMPAGQPVEAYWNHPIEDLGILLEPKFVSKTAAENGFSTNYEFDEAYRNEDPLVRQLGLTLLEESRNDSSSGRLYAESLIQSLTLHLLKNYSNGHSVPENLSGGLSGYRLRRVEEFIDANLESDISLAELAAVAGLSQFHFARAFRKSTGRTPQQFLTEKRVERAKRLLENDELPIVEVSLQSGFKNQSHFTSIFRKLTNLTPKTWRSLRLA